MRIMFFKFMVAIALSCMGLFAYADVAKPSNSEGWYFSQIEKAYAEKGDIKVILVAQLKLNEFCSAKSGFDTYQLSKAIAKHDRFKKPLIAANLANMTNTGIKQRYCYRHI